MLIVVPITSLTIFCISLLALSISTKELLLSRIDRAQKELYKKVHESRRDDDESIFAIGWNQAIGHVEAMIAELLGVDDKAAYEEFGI